MDLPVETLLVNDPEIDWFVPICSGVHTKIRSHRSSKLQTEYNLSDQDINMSRNESTLVMMTSSSRGRLSCLIALPSTTSDKPLEYTYLAVNDHII